MIATLFKNGLVFPMSRGSPRVMDVLVEDGKISAVGDNLERREARIVDCTGKMVFPGFIDAHCHIGLFGTATGERRG
ncbi:MAG: hypothetical protein R2881_08160 [Eubacteriales bacterium]